MIQSCAEYWNMIMQRLGLMVLFPSKIRNTILHDYIINFIRGQLSDDSRKVVSKTNLKKTESR